MLFAYPNLSAYAQSRQQGNTLNSEFYNLLFSQPGNFNNLIIFPQRIPKIGFFTELCALQGPIFTKLFKQRQAYIVQALESQAHSVRFTLNHAHLALRYGLCQKISELRLPANLEADDRYEFQWLKACAQVEYSLSNDTVIDLCALQNLVRQTLNEPQLSQRIKVLIYTRLIVLSYRHQTGLEEQTLLQQCHVELLNLLRSFSLTTFNEQLLASGCYRGLAMDPTLNKAQVAQYLAQAEQLANTLTPYNQFEDILAKENRYTLLQTLAKWQIRQSDFAAAKNYLETLTKLDPYDATGFSELGLFYARQNHYQNALPHFATAKQLGPPAVGMNAYFYGKCLEQLGQMDSAIAAYEAAAELDPLAVSPLLDLIKLHGSNGNKQKIKPIARQILNNPILVEQLQPEELINTKILSFA